MKINRMNVLRLMHKYCDDNYNRFARELDVNPSQLHRCLNGDVGGGKKILGALIKFCKSKGLNFEDYIEL